ncbi:MAG: NAD(P)H-dependent oxidoreductase [Fimbriimonadaceae bacterium]|nr:NAD(P)H-dependent oxidoreductase [Fimbriimonadaceae bacterium]QYK56107.1 MAG: NAD(P)H-dependent oxidoreductase [Fimbriimonadaceae bacterium]
MASLDLVVVYGSVRTERLGIRLARGVVKALEERGHKVTLIDPLEYRLPLLDKMWKQYGEGEAPEDLQRMHDVIVPADGFLIVTGEYNKAVPPALKNLLDHFLETWFWRPSGICSYSYGRFGGVRAASTLRQILAELGMPAVPSEINVPAVHKAFDEDGNPTDPDFAKWTKRFFEEFEWYAEAFKAQRAKGTPY